MIRINGTAKTATVCKSLRVRDLDTSAKCLSHIVPLLSRTSAGQITLVFSTFTAFFGPCPATFKKNNTLSYSHSILAQLRCKCSTLLHHIQHLFHLGVPLCPVKTALDVLHREPQYDRTSMRAGGWRCGYEQTVDQPLHLFGRQFHVDLDGGFAR